MSESNMLDKPIDPSKIPDVAINDHTLTSVVNAAATEFVNKWAPETLGKPLMAQDLIELIHLVIADVSE